MALALAAPAAGAREPRPMPGAQTRTAQAVSSWAFERLDRAHKRLEEGRYDEVLAVLAEMRQRRGLSSQEQSLMWQAFGYAYSAQEDYPRAVDAFEQCLAAQGLEPSVALNVTYNLAQLHVVLENYDRAIELFESWFAVAEKPNAGAHYMFAIAYLQRERFAEAIPHAEQAVRKSSSPRESYLGLLLGLYFEVHDFESAVPVLEALVSSFPKALYWKQLSALYAERGDNERALAALEVAHFQGYLHEERDILNLAQLYLYSGVPYRAAKLVEQGLSAGQVTTDAVSWQILADSLLQAREREQALAPLERAAELAEDGNLYVRLALIHIGDERWSAARAALENAFGKGGLRNPGQARLLLGIAHAGDRQWEAAARAFTTAMDDPETRATAAAWLANLKREKALAQD